MKSFLRFLLWTGVGMSLLVGVVAAFRRPPAREERGARAGRQEPPRTQLPSGRELKKAPAAALEEKPSDVGEGDPRGPLATEDIRKFWDRIVQKFGRDNKFPYAEVRGVDVHRRFIEEREFLLREARLLALAYPELAQSLAKEPVRDGNRMPAERVYGIYTLGYLGAQGRREAEEALAEVGRGDEWRTATIAMRLLARLDTQGRHESLILYWAQAGYPRVIEILGNAYTDARLGVLENILKREAEWRKYPSPQQNAAIYAELAHQRLKILLSPERDEVLRSILEDRIESRFRILEWKRWALHVARSTNLPSLMDILRRKLDFNEQEYRNYFLKYPSEAVNKSMEQQFEEGTYGIVSSDFDDFLVHYWELGGELNELEKRRLRYAGYACDPAQRLAELVRLGR